MNEHIWKFIALIIMFIGYVCQYLEIRKLKKRLKELEPDIKPKRESYGKCNECGGEMIEWIWDRKGFSTKRSVIACEKFPECKGVM